MLSVLCKKKIAARNELRFVFLNISRLPDSQVEVVAVVPAEVADPVEVEAEAVRRPDSDQVEAEAEVVVARRLDRRRHASLRKMPELVLPL